MRSRKEDQGYIQYRSDAAVHRMERTVKTAKSVQIRRHTGISGLLTIAAAIAIILGLMLTDSFSSLAQSEPNARRKCYKSITIEKGDTLWNIAEEYITDDYESVEEYISVLKDINNLHGDKILSGDKLIVSYNAVL